MKRSITLFIMFCCLASGAWANRWWGSAHQLYIKMDGPATKSFMVVGSLAEAYPNSTIGTCITKRAPNGWMPTGYVLKNGSRVKVLAFSSPDCTAGLRREKLGTVPKEDGLDYYWFKLF